MKRLLAAGGRMDVRSGDEDHLHRTCLHAAALAGHEPAVRLIIGQCKERAVGGWCPRPLVVRANREDMEQPKRVLCCCVCVVERQVLGAAVLALDSYFAAMTV